jgi:hypothetical protein
VSATLVYRRNDRHDAIHEERRIGDSPAHRRAGRTDEERIDGQPRPSLLHELDPEEAANPGHDLGGAKGDRDSEDRGDACSESSHRGPKLVSAHYERILRLPCQRADRRPRFPPEVAGHSG